MNAFLGDVNEILAAEDIDEDEVVSSEGPAPRERSWTKKKTRILSWKFFKKLFCGKQSWKFETLVWSSDIISIIFS